MYRDETIDLMEPMLPSEGNRELEDLVVSLIQATSSLKAILRPRMTETLGNLVRNMNCYYSNLIEGHNTTPRDIERALVEDFSSNPAKRDLQLEAKAHIEVQKLIDLNKNQDFVSIDFIQLLHREFCSRLPDSLLWIGEESNKKQVIPGEFRTGRVIVGEHTPPFWLRLLSYLGILFLVGFGAYAIYVVLNM